MSRLTFITILAFIVLVAGLSFDFQQKKEPESSKVGKIQNAEPDFYLINAKSREFDETGKLRYRFTAAELEHFPQGDYTLVETPNVTLFHSDGTAWYINANQGRVTADNETIKLWDKVVLKRGTPNDPLKMETRALTVFPKQDIAKTEQDVLITNRTGRIDSVGMISYIDENRMELLSNVRVRHEPVKVR